jgi:hypothetical protein
MAEIPLYEPGEDAPVPQPREDTRFTEVTVRPYADGREFTLHLRGPQPEGEHTVHLILFYPQNDDAPTDDRQVVDERSLAFVIPPPA